MSENESMTGIWVYVYLLLLFSNPATWLEIIFRYTVYGTYFTCWQDECCRYEVQVQISPTLILLCEWTPLALQVTPISLHVLHHQILPISET